MGLPWQSSTRKPASKAGDTGSAPGQQTKLPPAAGQLSSCAATNEATCSRVGTPCMREAMCCNEDPVQPKRTNVMSHALVSETENKPDQDRWQKCSFTCDFSQGLEGRR